MKKLALVFISFTILISLNSCSDSQNHIDDLSGNMQNTSSIESSEINSSEVENEMESSVSNNSDKQIDNASSKDTTVTSSYLTSSSTTTPLLKTIRITFPEGTTVSKMFDIFDEKGVAKKSELFSIMETYDFSAYTLASVIAPSQERCFKLEGYLFPNTYEFYLNDKPQNVIGKMLKEAEKRVTQEYRDRANALGYSMDQILSLASIIQKEAFSANEMAKVSSVFHNRLKAQQRLQSDVTIKYVEGAIKPYITGDFNRYNSYYNTYKCSGLPAGPICNPGITAIKAALYPEETDYYYFVTDANGNYYYAIGYDEHLVNCQIAGVTINN